MENKYKEKLNRTDDKKGEIIDGIMMILSIVYAERLKKSKIMESLAKEEIAELIKIVSLSMAETAQIILEKNEEEKGDRKDA